VTVPRSRVAAMCSHRASVERPPKSRFVLALTVALALGFAEGSRAQEGCGFGTYTPGHTCGSYARSGCCSFFDCPGPLGYSAPSFPPAPGPSTLTLPGLIPSPIYVAARPVSSEPTPIASQPPATDKQPSPQAAVPSSQTIPPPSTRAGRGPLRVMISQTTLN
jgi:hypothetical protein